MSNSAHPDGITVCVPPPVLQIPLASLDDALSFAVELDRLPPAEWVVALVSSRSTVAAVCCFDPGVDHDVVVSATATVMDSVAAAAGVDVVGAVAFAVTEHPGAVVPERHLEAWRTLRHCGLPVWDLVVVGHDHLFSMAQLAGEASLSWIR